MGKMVELARAWIAEQEASGRDSLGAEAQKPVPSVGQVILIESLAGQRTLAAIVGMVENHPLVPPGLWLDVATADRQTRKGLLSGP